MEDKLNDLAVFLDGQVEKLKDVKLKLNKRKSILVLIENDIPECYGNFKKICEDKEFPYHSLKMLKFPITYKDSIIYKVEFKQQVTDGDCRGWDKTKTDN